MNIRTIKPIISDFLAVLSFVEKKNKFKYLFLQIHIFFSSILETLTIFTIIPIFEGLTLKHN